MKEVSCDYLVVGAGVIGLGLARQLIQKFPKARILVLEKEQAPGLHASGRNSGVLHAGIYYPPQTLKARFCVQGNQAWRDYCETHSLKINSCGKLVVAPPGVDDAGLQTLYERGLANGAQVELVEGRRLRFLEPALRTIDRALFTPDTASVDPVEIMDRLKQELESLGVEIRVSTGMVRAVKKAVQDEAGNLYRFSHLFNCAGLHADRLARQFGFSEKYQILPFKGLYLKQSQGIAPLQRHLYPLPDLRFPFLGVHWTVGVDGGVKIGPNALPAWGRENYKGKEGFSWSEALKILLQQANLYLSRAEFRDLADQALASMGKKALFKAACQLLGHQPEAEFDQWYRPGIRAQLVDQEKGQLVQDFVVEGDTHSTHVLNAVSPGFTCALPFTQWIVEQVDDSKGPSWAKS